MQIFILKQIPDIVYHGSTTEHIESLKQIKIDYGRKDLDFGQGFYTTSIRRQAEEWAKGKAYGKHGPLLLTYKVNLDKIKSMNGMIFENASEEWTKFIFQHRMEVYNLGENIYDYVYGHTADGKTSLLIEDYKTGKLNYNDFKERIYPTKCKVFYYDQLFFRSQLSISALEKINEEVL